MILFSAALLSFAACNKVAVEEQPVVDDNDIVLTFTSERPQLDVDTRTAWNSETSSIVWSEGDRIRVGYTLDGNWMGQSVAGEAKFYSSTDVVIDESNAGIGTFKVPTSGAFTDPETEGTYVFYAIYPGSLLSNTTVSTAPSVPVTLNAIQNPTSGSFEGSTDIMVGKTDEMTIDKLPTDPIEIAWDRVVAHGFFTLKDLRGIVEGETITKVTLTAQEGAALAGSFSVSLEDGSFTATDATNEIVINGTDLAFVEESGMTNLKIWLSVLPETLTSLKVDVATNKANYVREITGISKTLKRNARNVLSINMSTADRIVAEEVVWIKKDITAITPSDVFVIVGNNGSNYAMTSDKGTDSAPAASAISVSGNKLTSNPVDNIQWTLSSSDDGYTFYPNGTTEKWLYCTNTNNGVRVGTNNNSAFTLAQGYLKNAATSRFVGIYNSTDWRCYTSINNNIAGQSVSFFVKTAAGDVKDTPTLTFTEPTTTVNVGETVTNIATIEPSNLTVTYSSSNEDVATVNAEGTVTGVAAGIATITASFAGNDTYEAVSASYEITVRGSANDGSLEHPYSASEARTLALNGDTGSYYIYGTVTKIQNQYSAGYGTANFWIDENGESQEVFEGYKIKYFGGANWVDGNAEIAIKDEVIIYGTLTVFKETTPETSSGYLVSLNGKTKGLTPGTLTATPDNDNKQITVTWGAATGTDSAISYEVSCGEQTYNATAAGSYTFTMANYGTYTVSLVASAEDAISASLSTSATLSNPGSTAPDPVTMNVFSSEATVTGSGEGQTATWTSGDITVTAVKTSSTATAFRNSDTDHTRFYTGWTITVSSAANTISSVEFTCTTSTYATTLANHDFSKGTASASGTLVLVSGVSDSETSTTLTGQVRVSSITVTYE